MKFNINDVINFVNERHPGAKVLSDERINYKIMINLICENSHKTQMRWNNIKYNNSWCKYCAGKDKKSIPQVQQYLNEHHPGAKVLSTKYISNQSKLNIQCEKGHIFKTDLNHIKNKYWCPYCAGNDKKSIEYVQEYINEHHPGAKVLSTEYKNSKTKLDIQCKNNHVFKMNWDSINVKNHWCPYCSGHFKKDILHVQKYLDKYHHGAKVLSENYIDNRTKLDLICEKGHKFQMTLSNIKNEYWCIYCSGHDKKDIQYIQNFINKKYPGAKLISSECKNAISKINIICENGHNFITCWNYIQSDNWCPYCLNKTEEEYRKIIEKLTGKKFPKCRPKWLKNPKTNYLLELDGYNEELKLAFEYQGEQHYKENTNYFSHIYTKEKVEKIQERDEIKKKLCEEHGVKLIVIPYWIENKQKFIEENLKII